MAKKRSKYNEKLAHENVLPQNILPIGEQVEEEKNIYIFQSVYKEIHKFTKNKLTNESGGMLIGNIIEALGKVNIIIQGFIEAKYCEATPTTLKFTHETWEYVHGEISKKYKGAQIVGWIHTHPDFGIFLSEYDKFIQENFFKEEYQIAYVVDPIQHIEGFYFWISGRIERCKGFYICDKAGQKIELDFENKDLREKRVIVGGNYTFLIYILIVLVIFLGIYFGIFSSNLIKRMQIIETRQDNLVESANQSIGYLQQQLEILQSELENIQNIENSEIIQTSENELEAEEMKSVVDNGESDPKMSNSEENTDE